MVDKERDMVPAILVPHPKRVKNGLKTFGKNSFQISKISFLKNIL